MDTWYSLPLGDGMTASDPSDTICSLFQPRFEAAGSPAGMAVFTCFDSEGRLQCDVTAYFSPDCAEIAQGLGARPCNKPPKAGLSLLAGDERAWIALFS